MNHLEDIVKQKLACDEAERISAVVAEQLLTWDEAQAGMEEDEQQAFLAQPVSLSGDVVINKKGHSFNFTQLVPAGEIMKAMHEQHAALLGQIEAMKPALAAAEKKLNGDNNG